MGGPPKWPTMRRYHSGAGGRTGEAPAGRGAGPRSGPPTNPGRRMAAAPQAGAAHPERGSSPNPAAHDSLERCALHPVAPASACAQRTRTGAAASATTPASGPDLTIGPLPRQGQWAGGAPGSAGRRSRRHGRRAGPGKRTDGAAGGGGVSRAGGGERGSAKRGGGAPFISPPQRYRTPVTIT